MPLPQEKPDTLRYLKLSSSIQRLKFRNGLLSPVPCATSLHIQEITASHPRYDHTSQVPHEASPWQESTRAPRPMRTSHLQERGQGRSSETLQVLPAASPPPHSTAGIPVPTASCLLNVDHQASEERPVRILSGALQDEMLQSCLESMKPTNPRQMSFKHLMRTNDHDSMPVVVNRRLPELGNLSNDTSTLGFGQKLEFVHWKDSMLDELSGETDVNNEKISASDKTLLEHAQHHAPHPQPPLNDINQQHNSHASAKTTPAPKASTSSTSPNAASAATAATTDPHQATACSSTRSREATTPPSAASGNPSAPDPGSPKPTGFPSSLPSRRPLPPPSTAPLYRDASRGIDPRPVSASWSPPRKNRNPPHRAAALPLLATSRPLTTASPNPSLGPTLRTPSPPASSPIAPIPILSATNTRSDITATTPSRPPNVFERRRASPDILSTVGPGSRTPLSDFEGGIGGSDVEVEYETPMTSPGSLSSPYFSLGREVKMRPVFLRGRSFWGDVGRVDGAGDDGEGVSALNEVQSCEGSAGGDYREFVEVHGEEEERDCAELIQDRCEDDLDVETGDKMEDCNVEPRRECGYADLTLPPSEDRSDLITDSDEDNITPLVPASPAKNATGFPFPSQSESSNSITSRTRFRHPSALLPQREQNPTPRQRSLLATGVQTPDRFIPSRACTPRKETLLLPRPAQKLSPNGQRIVSPGLLEDPFGPLPRRSLRMIERHATIRHPPPPSRGAGMLTSRVRDAAAVSPVRRTASAGTVWTVGGAVVTEGVASTPNGRGGRVTSGSNAPHYSADFLRRSSPSEEDITHGRRLAVAMEIDPRGRMMGQGAVGAETDGATRRVWRDGVWGVEGVVAANKVKTKKEKDVPIIPFRVLDAPALRDDYYCSLLAYSPTVECLAVGLGPHVYLWSETKGKTNIPDSLTAPLGTSHVTSVSFSSAEGGSAILAIGRADGRITLWSPLDRDPRFDSEQPAPVSCVCFRPNPVRRTSLRDPIASVATEELLVGDETGAVYYYSIEWPNQNQRDLFDWHGSMTLLARITCHSQQICGIAWSPDGEVFATGGNDNQLFLFESKKLLRPSSSRRSTTSPTSPIRVRNASSSGAASTTTPATLTGQGPVLAITPGQETHTFTLNAAVKAIAFAPWQPSLLAAGSGSNDRCIHFLHTASGAALATIDCHAQVTSLIWSSRRKEIAATFGFAQPEHPFRVAVFSWPECGMVVGIPWWGEERALFAVPYPRGPSLGFQGRQGRRRRGEDAARVDAEGQAWYGKRTREEGCLVVATSDASIKFHEIWAERREGGKKSVVSGPLGGSQILEGECSPEIERAGAIR